MKLHQLRQISELCKKMNLGDSVDVALKVILWFYSSESEEIHISESDADHVIRKLDTLSSWIKKGG